MKKAFLQLHFAVLLAGFTGILGRLITLNEGLLVAYRLFFTSAIVWIIYGWQKKIHRVPGKDLIKIAAVGFIAAMHWVTFYGSIKNSNVSVALVCFSSIGFFTALAEPLILHKRINKFEVLLGLVIIFGIYIIFRFNTQYKTGIVFGIISAMLAALFPIYNRQFLQRMNVETLLAYQQTAGLITLLLVLPVYFQFYPPLRFTPGWEDLGWLLVLSVFCSVIAYQFSFYALKRLSAFTVNLTYNLEPVYGILLAFLVYHENKYLSNWFYLGFAIIAAALTIHLFMLIRAERKIVLHGSE